MTQERSVSGHGTPQLLQPSLENRCYYSTLVRWTCSVLIASPLWWGLLLLCARRSTCC